MTSFYSIFFIWVKFFFLLFCCFSCFSRLVSLSSHGCLGTHAVDQAGLDSEMWLPLPPRASSLTVGLIKASYTFKGQEARTLNTQWRLPVCLPWGEEYTGECRWVPLLQTKLLEMHWVSITLQDVSVSTQGQTDKRKWMLIIEVQRVEKWELRRFSGRLKGFGGGGQSRAKGLASWFKQSGQVFR